MGVVFLASNSDSIFNILSYLKRHPEKIFALRSRYDNVIQIFFKDVIKFADANIYFPDNKLMVNCLTDDFLAQNGDLLDSFWQLAGHDYIDHHEVWATTSHLTQKNMYLLELSFE